MKIQVFTAVIFMNGDTMLFVGRDRHSGWMCCPIFRFKINLEVAYSSETLVDTYKALWCQVHKMIILITVSPTRYEMF